MVWGECLTSLKLRVPFAQNDGAAYGWKECKYVLNQGSVFGSHSCRLPSNAFCWENPFWPLLFPKVSSKCVYAGWLGDQRTDVSIDPPPSASPQLFLGVTLVWLVARCRS